LLLNQIRLTFVVGFGLLQRRLRAGFGRLGLFEFQFVGVGLDREQSVLRCEGLPRSKNSNNPLAAELESENDGCRTKIFLSVLSQFHFC
jgi:hypothetical protein